MSFCHWSALVLRLRYLRRLSEGLSEGRLTTASEATEPRLRSITTSGLLYYNHMYGGEILYSTHSRAAIDVARCRACGIADRHGMDRASYGTAQHSPSSYPAHLQLV